MSKKLMIAAPPQVQHCQLWDLILLASLHSDMDLHVAEALGEIVFDTWKTHIYVGRTRLCMRFYKYKVAEQRICISQPHKHSHIYEHKNANFRRGIHAVLETKSERISQKDWP